MTITEKSVIRELEKNSANIHLAAKALGVSRGALADRIHKSVILQAAQSEILESVVDDAESNMLKAAQEGNLGACKFVLATRRKDVYANRTEHTGAGGSDFFKGAGVELERALAVFGARVRKEKPA